LRILVQDDASDVEPFGICNEQQKNKKDEGKQRSEEQIRQRKEMSHKDDADTTKPEVEEEKVEPVTGLREDVVEYDGSKYKDAFMVGIRSPIEIKLSLSSSEPQHNPDGRT
jgi:hypothetical protein